MLKVERGKIREYVDTESGERFFSVSEVRAVMWDGFSKVPRDILEPARERGMRLHAYFVLALGAMANACVYPTPLPGAEGYCKAIDQWILDWRPIPKAIEEPSVNRKLGIAGTRDADVELVEQVGCIDMVDLKTGDKTPTDAVQLLAYKTLDGCERHKRLFDLYVHADGTYDFTEVKPILHQADWAAFLNAVQVLRWRANK